MHSALRKRRRRDCNGVTGGVLEGTILSKDTDWWWWGGV